MADGSATWGLDQAAARARAWMREACFPFWAQYGVDPRGGFHEALDFSFKPLVDLPARVRVQARQTYVFAAASAMGWRREEALALVERGAETLLGRCRRSDKLFGRIIERGGGLTDDAPGLYDNAFVLFALAWAARALQEPRLLDEADRTLEQLDRKLAHRGGGYQERAPERGLRRQNPHMHLLEALLALYAAGGRDHHLAHADRIVELMAERFVHPETGRLHEVFDDRWRPASGDQGITIEPGHEFEWVWLLGQWADVRKESLPDVARQLYRNACETLDARGFAPQTIRLDGAAGDASRRTWPQTEALKAHLTMREHGDASAEPRAAALALAFFKDYLEPAPPGGWIDHYSPDGAPAARNIPASTGYHVVCAFAELVRAVRPRSSALIGAPGRMQEAVTA